MRAAVLTDDHRLEPAEVPDPAPGPGELLLRVEACGICGSDLKVRSLMPSGYVMGHEFCGEIVAVGRDIGDEWRVGDAAAALPVIGCGTCAACVAGEPAHCERADLIGIGGSAGGFAEYVRVSAREAFVLPDSVTDGHGALVEPLARARLAPGDSVLVVGAGPVGLAVMAWARQLGAATLVASDPSPERRAAAELFGADRVVDPQHEDLGERYDVVFECVGLPGLTDICVRATKTRGRVVMVGVCTRPDPYVPLVALMKEVSIHFAVYYTRREFAHVIDALARGTIDPSAFVTKRVGLDAIDDAFRTLTEAKQERKILVLP
jgi:(R,R)-butanediol dehydrogenase/meso-butanediol dehydrogenase/diacetyl reductase